MQVGDGSEKDSDDGTEGDHGRMRASSCVQPSALNDLTGLHIFRSDAALSTSAVDIEQGKVSSSGNVPLSGSEPRLWSLEEDGDDLVKVGKRLSPRQNARWTPQTRAR
jgi:hypothetical protein